MTSQTVIPFEFAKHLKILPSKISTKNLKKTWHSLRNVLTWDVE